MKSHLSTDKEKQEVVELFKQYNPSLHAYCINNPERSINGKAPTLIALKKKYGEQAPIDWLKIHINDYLNFLSVKEDNTPMIETMNELAGLMFARYNYLKLSEFLLFFGKLKCGDFYDVYGRVDPPRILKALASFVEFRNTVISRLEQEERKKKTEEDSKNAVSYSEYLKSKSNKTVVL